MTSFAKVFLASLAVASVAIKRRRDAPVIHMIHARIYPVMTVMAAFAQQHQIPRWGCDSKIVDILLERDFEAFVRFEHVAISKMTGFLWL